jgi:outer membrane receptor protein involved in Fe transport
MRKIFPLLFFLPFTFFAQNITGSVIDKGSGQPLSGVKVMYGGSVTLSNTKGEFAILVDSLPAVLLFDLEGYETETRIAESVAPLTVALIARQQQETDLENVVVVATRRLQRAEEVSVSLEVLKPGLINNKGIVDLEQAVDQSPGVYAMDGQVSIRGGGGFAYGAGSRVLVLYNEMPLVSADAGDVKWNAIPIEGVSRIEILKGASSVLYGSGALNGIISLVERQPAEKPYLLAKAQSGIYDDPQRASLKWWNKNPMFQQADVFFSRKWRAFGLNVGGYGYNNDGYRQGEVETRGRFNGTLFYQREFKRFSATLGWNAQLSKAGNFLVWQSDTFAYQPQGGADTSVAGSSLTYNRGFRFNIDPTMSYRDRFGNRHDLKTRLYLTDNRNYNNTSQSAQGIVKFANYQFSRDFGSYWIFTAGAAATHNSVDSYLYGDHSSFNGAVYAQGEFRYEKLDVTAGVRGEYFRQDDLRADSWYYLSKDSSSKIPVTPIFRAGVHYELFKYTHLRASFGQGVRYPSVAERYTATSVGSLNIFPNPALLAERGWAAEIGIKQGVKISNWKGFIDVAGFVNHYDNMMEFTFGNYIPDSVTPSLDPNAPGYLFKWIGFRAENAEEARIAGVEISFSSEGTIGPVKLQTLIGYTYMNPVAIDPDPAYRASFSDTTTNMLKYRFNHLAKADVQLTYKGFSLGGSMRYNSFMKNIDATFEDEFLNILPGLRAYRMEHNKGNIVFDARIGYEFLKHYKVAFIVNNVANAEYMGRPGDIQAPRSFIAQLQYTL